MSGAGRRTRTADLLITNQQLYQLSYAGFSPFSSAAWGLMCSYHYAALAAKIYSLVKNVFVSFSLSGLQR